MSKPELTVLDGGKPAEAKASRRPRAKSLAQAIADDDQVAELKALRSVLAKRIQDPKTSAVAIAALTKQFRELGEQITAASGGGSPATGGEPAGEPVPDEDWDDDF
jgi:hypothetical protein